MLKSNLIFFIKGLFVGLGFIFTYWNSPLYLGQIFSERNEIELFVPLFFAFLIFLILVGFVLPFKKWRQLLICLLIQNLKDTPSLKESLFIFLSVLSVVIGIKLTSLTPISSLAQLFLIEPKNLVLVATAVLTGSILRKLQSGHRKYEQRQKQGLNHNQ